MQTLTLSQSKLPIPRGPITDALFSRLRDDPASLDQMAFEQTVIDRLLASVEDPLTDDDFHLALYCIYELHYQGFADVAPRWEWQPTLIALRNSMEMAFEKCLREDSRAIGSNDGDVVGELWRIAGDDSGPSLSAWLVDHGTITHARELAVHRSAYQLKEADPHTWGIPRLAGRAKAAMVAIQADEYGNGDALAMHSSLFADTMEALGLQSAYGAYLAWLPGVTLATTNLISLLGLHRRLRGALVGHLALFEMTSVGPMERYSRWMERLGIPRRGRRFYDVHVEADAVHQLVASSDLVGGLLETDPELAEDVLFGARALMVVEGRMSSSLRQAWAHGDSALLPGCPVEG